MDIYSPGDSLHVCYSRQSQICISFFFCLSVSDTMMAFQESWMEKKINDELNIMENHGTGPFMFPFLVSY